MLSRHIQTLTWLTAAALTSSAALAAGASNRTQATFVSRGKDLAFALSVPTDDNDPRHPLLFSLAIPAGLSWGAVGLGSGTMDNALVLLMYADDRNVTVTARLASGHSEPALYQGPEIIPAESQLVNGTLLFRGYCMSCRSWPGGSVDTDSTTAKAIYALGPPGGLSSRGTLAPPLRMHAEYGSFTMDLRSATGPVKDPPVLDAESRSQGTTLVRDRSGVQDWVASVHALFMVACFVGLYPFGVIVLRLGQRVRWHAVNQSLATAGVVAGFGLGIRTSLYYVRSKRFSSAHQIIGFIVVGLVFVQFFLGVFHHRIFKKTQQTTKLAYAHVQSGRIAILLGIANAFVGFHFAQARKYDYVLAGLVLAIIPVVVVILCSKRFLSRLRGQPKSEAAPPGYDAEPWRRAPPPGYSSQPAGGSGDGDIALSTFWNGLGLRKGDANESTRDLGARQLPREHV